MRKYKVILQMFAFGALAILSSCDHSGGAGQGTGGSQAGTNRATALATQINADACTDNCLAVSVDNLKNNGVVHSGFLVGTAGGDVAQVNVSLDAGSPQPATGTANWKFQFPIGTAGWKDNSVHTVSVTALNAQGQVVTVNPTLSVRKGNNQDVDGDGFADLLVGDPGFDSNRGRVYVFYSRGNTGIASTADVNNPDDTNVKFIEGAAGEGPQRFGASVAMGDVDGEGHADLVVGAPARGGDTGEIYVFYAAPDGNATTAGGFDIATNSAGGTNTQIMGDSEAVLAFGTSVATGDVNGDGIADVAAGAPGTAASPDDEVGTVYVFHAHHDDGVQGLAPPTVFGHDGEIQAATHGTNFGITVALGDVNGDATADLLVGETAFADVQGHVRGQAYVFHAAADGSGIPATIADDANTTITGEDNVGASQFGASLAVGDLNGDGFEDLVAGAPALSDPTVPGDAGRKRGKVYVHYSAGTQGVPTDLANNRNTATRHAIGGEQNSTGDQLFAASVAVGGIVNSNGNRELVVGAPAAANGLGLAYVFFASNIGVNSATVPANANQVFTGVAGTSQGIGTALATADVTGDGFADLAIGGVSSSGAGQVFVLNGPLTTAAPLSPPRTVLEANTTLTGAVGSTFGAAIAQ